MANNRPRSFWGPLAISKRATTPPTTPEGPGGPTDPETPTTPGSAPIVNSVTVSPTSGRSDDLFTSTADASGFPAPAFSYQWRINGTAIPGATSSTYIPPASIVSGNLSVEVTATNASGTSNPVVSNDVTFTQTTYPDVSVLRNSDWVATKTYIINAGLEDGSKIVEVVLYDGSLLTFPTSGSQVIAENQLTNVASPTTFTLRARFQGEPLSAPEVYVISELAIDPAETFNFVTPITPSQVFVGGLPGVNEAYAFTPANYVNGTLVTYTVQSSANGTDGWVDEATPPWSLIPTGMLNRFLRLKQTVVGDDGVEYSTFSATSSAVLDKSIPALPTFPAAISTSDWNAVTVTDFDESEGVEGKRKITIQPAVTIPTGFRLFASASTSSGSVFSTSLPEFTSVIREIITSGTFAVGSTVYPKLYWYRTADGSNQIASERPSFTVEALAGGSLPPTLISGVGGTWSGDTATFSSYLTGDLILAFASRGSTGDITVPAGWTLVTTEQDSTNYASVAAWRIAASDGADTLGSWTGATVVRYLSFRNVHETTPVRQFAYVYTDSGTSINNPALPGNTSGNSVVVTFSRSRLTTEGHAPGIRSDCTLLINRTAAGSGHGSVAISTANPVAAGAWAAQSVPTLGTGNTAGGIAWAIEIDGIASSGGGSGTPEEPDWPTPANIVVSNRTELSAALSGVASGAGSDYIIDVAPGIYGDTAFTFPTNYNKTKRVIIRGQEKVNPPTFRTISASGAQNITFENIRIVGIQKDEWGYPGGANANGLNIVGGRNIIIRDCFFANTLYSIQMNGIQGALIEWCTFVGWANDSVRMYQEIADVTFRNCRWRDPLIDIRRSDQAGYKNDTEVPRFPGDPNPPLVTGTTKAGRHPDCIQANNKISEVAHFLNGSIQRGLLVEDCHFSTFNGYHQVILLARPSPGAFPDNGSTGIIIRRVLMESAHTGALFLVHTVGALVEDLVIRNFPRGSDALWSTSAPANSTVGLGTPTILLAGTSSGGTLRRIVVPSERGATNQGFALEQSNPGDVSDFATSSISQSNSNWTTNLTGAPTSGHRYGPANVVGDA